MTKKPTYEQLEQRAKELENEAVERRRLEEQTRLLSLAIEQSSEGIAVVDLDGNLKYSNDAFAKIHGYSLKEIIGKNLSIFHTPQQMPSVEEANREIKETGEFKGEIWHVRRNGTVFPTLMHNSLLRDEAGTPIGVIGTLRDITERKQAEEALRESESRLANIIGFLPDATFAIDLEGRVIIWNWAMEKMTGIKSEEILGKGNYEYAIPFYGTRRPLLINLLLKSDKKVEEKYKFISRKGDHFIAELDVPITVKGKEIFLWGKASPVYDSKGKIIGAIQSIRDITKRKQDEEEIIKRQKYMESVVHSAPDAIVALDASHNIIEWNPGAERIFGYSRDEVIGKDLDDLISLPDMKHELKALTKHILSGETVLSHETVRHRKDGTPVNVIVAGSPIKIEGKFFGAVAIYTDITEKEKLESQLRQAQKMEAIGTLAGGIAHDFNNILAAIIGYAELAKIKVPDGSKALSDLDQVLKLSSRAETLVQQIIAFSRKQELEQKPLQLKYIIKEILKLIRFTLPTDIEIKQDIAKDVGVVNADPTQMQQVIMNLCINAGHAMQELGGVLEVSLQEAGPNLKLTVKDSGHGMNSELLERIFDPYFTTKEKGVGTGLGLSVVNGIVDSHGGTITVESEPGKGSAFHVYLPLIQEGVIKPEIDIDAPISTGNERILFIDDELALVDIGKQMLEHFGYEVTSRTSSIEALELFRTKPDQFDLVITDMTMPNMTGDKLAKELMKIRSDIPIILCTGFSERVSEEKVKGMGIKDFAMKPVVIQDLAKTVRKVLDAGRSKV